MSKNTEKLLANTLDDAGCMVWQGGCANGHPAVTIGGKTLLVRRVLWEEMNGPLKAGEIVRCTCQTPKCINPGCTVKTTHCKLAKQMGAVGLMSGQVRSAAIAKAKRSSPQAKLSAEAVRELRASDEHVPTLAAKLGISEGHAYKVRRNVAQRDYGNPFAGLLG